MRASVMEEGGTASSRYEYHTDGTPCEVKVSCTVWVRGKSGDDFKGLPIDIVNNDISVVFLDFMRNGKLYGITMRDAIRQGEVMAEKALSALDGSWVSDVTKVPYIQVRQDEADAWIQTIVEAEKKW